MIYIAFSTLNICSVIIYIHQYRFTLYMLIFCCIILYILLYTTGYIYYSVLVVNSIAYTYSVYIYTIVALLYLGVVRSSKMTPLLI